MISSLGLTLVNLDYWAINCTIMLFLGGTPRVFDDSFKNTEHESSDNDKEQPLKPSLTLDVFLVKNTSEDNASFEKIMEVTRKKHREKYAWLFEKQQEQSNKQVAALTLPSSNEEQLKALESQSNNVETWKYVAKNALMYPPDGVEFSVEEIIEKKGKKEQEIRHENTRSVTTISSFYLSTYTEYIQSGVVFYLLD